MSQVPCKCRVRRSRVDDHNTILYCPVHAIAKRTLAAVRELYNCVEHLDCGCNHDNARALLRDLEGEERT